MAYGQLLTFNISDILVKEHALKMVEGEWGFVIIWEFFVRAGSERRFEQVYGPEGEWAKFFKAGSGFVKTDLNRDFKVPRRYVTLDFWSSHDVYTRFREANLAAYKAIDQRCEALTESETELGSFERISGTEKVRA